jgi:serine/threonine-protein kinase
MSDELTAGTDVAGRYRLRRCIGSGGMGEVWEAEITHAEGEREQAGQVVALKFVKGAANAKLRRRLLREAKAACALPHPHVVQVHDIIELDDGSPVMVMEYLEGESFAERLTREGEMPLETLAPLMQQVASAVGEAHAQGIVHRDLKPENLFVTEDAHGHPTAKILDFGIAKLAPSLIETSQSTELTRTGALMGTPCYMSPEQIYGEKDIDGRADIWALGIIMYRALSGILPTHADNVGQVMKIITTRPIWPLARTCPDLPKDVASLIDRMVSRERSDRPSSMHEVCEVLARHTDCATPDFEEPANVSSDAAPSSERIALQISTNAEPLGETAPLMAKRPSRKPTLALAAVAVVGLAAWLARGQPEASVRVESAQLSSVVPDHPAAPASPVITSTTAPAPGTSSSGATSSGPVVLVPSVSTATTSRMAPRHRAPPPALATMSATPSSSPATRFTPAPTSSYKIVEDPPF